MHPAQDEHALGLTQLVPSEFAVTSLLFHSLFTDSDHPSVCTTCCMYTPLSSSSWRVSVSNTLIPCLNLLSRSSSVLLLILSFVCVTFKFNVTPCNPSLCRLNRSPSPPSYLGLDHAEALSSVVPRLSLPISTLHSACEIEMSLCSVSAEQYVLSPLPQVTKRWA